MVLRRVSLLSVCPCVRVSAYSVRALTFESLDLSLFFGTQAHLQKSRSGSMSRSSAQGRGHRRYNHNKIRTFAGVCSLQLAGKLVMKCIYRSMAIKSRRTRTATERKFGDVIDYYVKTIKRTVVLCEC